MFDLWEAYKDNKDKGQVSMRRPCRYCDSVEHTQFYCRLKPRAAIKAKKSPQKIGKYGKQWLITRATWFERNPAEYYTCYLQIASNCLGVMRPESTTLDHIKSRSRHPELRFDLANLAPCCWPCNELKGGKNLEQVMEKLNG